MLPSESECERKIVYRTKTNANKKYERANKFGNGTMLVCEQKQA